MRPALAFVLALLLTACATLPTPPADGPGCQVRAGAAYPEGAVTGGIGSTSIAAVGGAATIIGECPESFRVCSRSQNGSMVCNGDEAFCAKCAENRPIEVTPAQLREFVNDLEAPSPEGVEP